MNLTTKQQFIIALIFICTFLGTSAFIFIYGMITKTTIWDSFQPYFTALIGPVGVILGYYFKSYTVEGTTTTETK